ncbi:cupin domain-containing protein [Epibacterium sp. SM1969]|uniref:Cupin domain-containing protein n=1 Tax=Tritonibacter aquimaris TaxID=2663379 RepID=A0A844AQ52_9RHOB|nr:cupin domain-containing protein [Tritonibacter aquimaris]MQY42973.1 cupin domain-containing protein [Tritonibacter aquimaris]
MPKLDLSKIPTRHGATYPGKLSAPCEGRSTQRLGDAGGLSQFGANLVHLAPGTASSLRHYHMNQDEFVMVTAGICTLVDDDGAHDMAPGDCATFPAGEENGHHFINNTNDTASFLVIGTRTETETAFYSDLDLMVKFAGGDFEFTRKDGSALTTEQTGEDT